MNDGGPAFPIPVAQPYGEGWLAVGGLTALDVFAMAALPPLIKAALDLDHEKWDATVEHAYEIAALMVREKQRRAK